MSAKALHSEQVPERVALIAGANQGIQFEIALQPGKKGESAGSGPAGGLFDKNATVP